MDSALYKCLVMHNRIAPKKHRFHYNVFMFWLDIDKLDKLASKLKLLSYNKPAFLVFGTAIILSIRRVTAGTNLVLEQN